MLHRTYVVYMYVHFIGVHNNHVRVITHMNNITVFVFTTP